MTAPVQRLRYAWQNSSHPLVTAGHRLVDRDGRPFWPTVRTTFPQQQLSLRYAGVAEGFANIVPLLEQLGEPVLGPAHRGPRHSVRRRVLHHPPPADADILAVGCRKSLAHRLPGANALVLPFRIHLVVDVDDELEKLRLRISKRERWEFNRNRRRSGWTVRVGSRPDDFWFFYRRMHQPTMDARHGERARTERPDVAFHGVFRQGFLFFVEQGGHPVAGALCRLDATTSTLTTRLLGVLDGAAEHYASGAFKAVYHFLLEWCSEHQVEHLDFHGTEAFLAKGIFQWKRKFHPRITLAPNHHADKRLWLRATRDTPAVRDFLVANPVLEIASGTQLRAVWFYDDTRPARSAISCGLPGVTEECHRHLDELLGGLPGPAPQQSSSQHRPSSGATSVSLASAAEGNHDAHL
ncbi:hypothetical protein AB0368_33915 [Actinoplanes sp. NPDC051475]|uniref:hypothetical protein n=1 Tax=Actinoplanes sp. NPDC051475 TaxID=3157225 RepID=UPI0034506822